MLKPIKFSGIFRPSTTSLFGPTIVGAYKEGVDASNVLCTLRIQNPQIFRAPAGITRKSSSLPRLEQATLVEFPKTEVFAIPGNQRLGRDSNPGLGDRNPEVTQKSEHSFEFLKIDAPAGI